ncbi:MAG TPA: hydantoinase B/oxoprolinase family protein [Chthoniobacterales bacterium]
MDAPKQCWKIAADTGGTFTDCLAVDPSGKRHRVKVLSRSALRGIIQEIQTGGRTLRVKQDWGAPDNFVRDFEFRILGESSGPRVEGFSSSDGILELESPVTVPPGTPFEVISPEEAPVLAARLITQTVPDQPLPPVELRVATTRGTNALLEERGARVALFITKGFGDLLKIGTQQRPDLFALKVETPRPLTHRVIEVNERLDSEGNILVPLEIPDVESLKTDCDTAAVAFLHSYRNPIHEEKLAARLRETGFQFVSLSSELAPAIKILPRAQTAVADAYLGPVMDRYLSGIQSALNASGSSLLVMTSAGGLIPSADFRPKDSLLSGPAGGVIGVAAAAKSAGFSSAIGLDMGGTSTDVCRWAGKLEYRFQHEAGRAKLMAPALKIETVAAGGGSICGVDPETGRLFVGPESAGANPGPACYGCGGPLTLTDVNLLIGRLDPARFGLPVDVAAARAAAERVREVADLDLQTLLLGFLEIANERMAAAISRISVREGYDPGESILVAFGGAGGQHACAIADQLGMTQVLCPSEAGLLSASGLLDAAVERFAEKQILRPMAQVDLETEFGPLISAAREKLTASSPQNIEIRKIAQLRLSGQETPLDMEFSSANDIVTEFQTKYRTIYGYFPEGREIEVAGLRVVASTGITASDRENFDSGEKIVGPALLQDRFATVLVDTGWKAVRGNRDSLLLETFEFQPPGRLSKRSSLGIDLELFTHRFETIVAEMGVLLQRTAFSTNIKERLDFSCALLDADGQLIVNAPHIPVHLGALGLCVRTVASRLELGPGDMVVTNHPAAGGSHLPDVTVISAVFDSNGSRLGYVANRGHHAEIGGISPGSMSPAARILEEEGAILPPMYLFRAGRACFDDVRTALLNAPFPTRAVEINLADLKAQAAANRNGIAALESLATRFGADRVRFFMSEIKRQAADAMRTRLRNFLPGNYSATEKLDDGTQIALELRVTSAHLEVDFSGTSVAHPGNLNATAAIVRSALIYVLRLWVQHPLPLNEGLLEPVSIHLPVCFLNPATDVAVAAGNVETSQRLVDTFLRALGVLAGGQGTMNNLLFGNNRVSYYETIGGGCGAGPGFEGASGVHSHMTNTAITDPEVLEFRFPVRLERFAIRKGSGGAGKFRGGDGLIREMTFLEPVTLSLLTQHRVEEPFGIDGGKAGKRGRQYVLKVTTGEQITLGSMASIDLETGDRLIVETPGGGGWGKAEK